MFSLTEPYTRQDYSLLSVILLPKTSKRKFSVGSCTVMAKACIFGIAFLLKLPFLFCLNLLNLKNKKMLSKYHLLQSISLPSIYKNGHTYHNSVITRQSIYILDKRLAKRQSSSCISCSQNNGKSIFFHSANDFLLRGFQTPETGGFSH